MSYLAEMVATRERIPAESPYRELVDRVVGLVQLVMVDGSKRFLAELAEDGHDLRYEFELGRLAESAVMSVDDVREIVERERLEVRGERDARESHRRYLENVALLTAPPRRSWFGWRR